MQPTYFASFHLGKIDAASRPTIGDLAQLLEEWIFNNRHRALKKPADFVTFSDQNYDFENRTTVQTRHLKTQNENIEGEVYGLRFEHLDEQSRRWRTDVVVDAENGTQQPIRCSIGVSVGNSLNSMAPLGDVVSRPRIVPTIINTLGAHEAFGLISKPVQLRNTDIDIFVNLLEARERNLPIVLVTNCHADGVHLPDINKLADQLAGIAYVCATNDQDFTNSLRERIGLDHYAFDGALRIYWPGFSKNDSKFRHRLCIRSRVESIEEQHGGSPKYFLRLLSRLSSTRHVTGIFRWEDIQKKRLTNADIKNIDFDELQTSLEEAWDKEAGLVSQIEELKNQLNIKEQEIAQIETASVYWRLEYQKIQRRNPNSTPVENSTSNKPILNIGDAIKRAATAYSNSLRIPGAVMRKEASLYEDPQEIFDVLEWIATTYHAAKAGDAPGTDLDHSCREETGFTYSANQSEITMSKAKGDYNITHDGISYSLEEHVKKGTSTDPRYTIRIAFAYDEEIKKVIIGFIGQHQKTSKSN